MNLNPVQTPLIILPTASNGEATKESNGPFTEFAMILFSALAPPKVGNSGDPADGGVSTPSDVALLEHNPISPAPTVAYPAKPDEAFTPNAASIVSFDQPIDGSMRISMGAVVGSPSPQSESPNKARALVPNPMAAISGSADGEIMAAIFAPQSGGSVIDGTPGNGGQVIIEPPLFMELAQTTLSVSLPPETKSPAAEQGDSIQPGLDGADPIDETSREGNDPLANFGNSVRDAERAILQALLADAVPASSSSGATESLDAALGSRVSTHLDILPSASHAAAVIGEAAKNNHPDEPTEVSFMNPTLVHSAVADSPQRAQRSSLVIEPSKTDPSEQGNAIGLGHVSASEKNLGQIVAAIVRRDSELTPALKVDHQPPVETGSERNEEGVEKPAEAIRYHTFPPDQSEQRQSSLGSEKGAWPREGEKTSRAIERPVDSTTVANGAMIDRQAPPRDAEVADTRWLPVIERVADDIVNHARIGQRQAVLQLDPPELGKIKIDLRIEDGKLHAHITAEVRDSKLLIETHLPELRQALLAGQRDAVDVRVVQGDWSGSSSNFGQGFHHAPPGQQETGWRSDDGSSRTREAPVMVNTQRPTREQGRVSMWA